MVFPKWLLVQCCCILSLLSQHRAYAPPFQPGPDARNFKGGLGYDWASVIVGRSTEIVTGCPQLCTSSISLHFHLGTFDFY